MRPLNIGLSSGLEGTPGANLRTRANVGRPCASICVSRSEVAEAAAATCTLGDEVLIEEMVSTAVAELIIGIKRDPQFGLYLVIGAGGIADRTAQGHATLTPADHRTG